MIKIINKLLTIFFLFVLIATNMNIYAAIDFPMSLKWTVLNNWNWLSVWSVIKAYCWNTNEEIWKVTIVKSWEYWINPTNYLSVNKCVGQLIYVQATVDWQFTKKITTRFLFTKWIIKVHNISFTTTEDEYANSPSAPSWLKSVAVSQFTTVLSWKDNSDDEQGFEIYKWDNLINTVAKNVLAYRIDNLDPWIDYDFWVRAINNYWVSWFTKVKWRTLFPPKAIDLVSGEIPEDEDDITNTNIKIKINNSNHEIIVKDEASNIKNNVDVIKSIISNNDPDTLTSIKNDTWNIVLAKRAIQFQKLWWPLTSDPVFDQRAKDTSAVVEATVLIPSDTTSSLSKNILVSIPKQTLISDGNWSNIDYVNIMPPVDKNADEVNLPSTEGYRWIIRAGVEISTNSDNWIKFDKLVDICLSSNWANSNTKVYSSNDWNDFAVDDSIANISITWGKYCFQVDHLTTFILVDQARIVPWQNEPWWNSTSPDIITQVLAPSNSYGWWSSDISTVNFIDFQRITDWITPVWIEMKHTDYPYSIKIEKGTRITYDDWTPFDGELFAVKRVSNKFVPDLIWNKRILKTIKIWATDLRSLRFSKPVRVTFWTEGIWDDVRTSSIYIYSYDEKNDKYIFDNWGRKVDLVNKTISVNVDHMTYFILVEWRDIVFTDIEDHWAKTHIEKLYDEWILILRNKFFPEMSLKRAELVKIALESFWHWINGDVWSVRFRDVNKSDWYAWYLSKAIEMWIIDWPSSINDFRFRPWENVTRSEALKIILKAAWVNPGLSWNLKFNDVRPSDWFARYVDYAVSNWIVSWFANWEFRPWNNISRWSIAKITSLAMEMIE